VRKFLNFLCITCFVLLANQVWATTNEIVVVQSSTLEPYEQARLAFERQWGISHPHTGVKSIMVHPIDYYLLSSADSEIKLKQTLAVNPPALLVAIGSQALAWCRDYRQLPVVYLMTPNPQKIIGQSKKITGIDMNILPSRQLAAVKAALPKVNTIGALYNPKQTGYWVQEALLSDVGDVQTMVFRKISKATDFQWTLDSLGRSLNAYWMLPDQLVATPQTIKFLLNYSLQNQIPIITFSEKYLAMGAAVAVTFSIDDMGAQAAEMCARILGGVPVKSIEVEHPRRVRVIANLTVLEKMGVAVNRDALTDIFKPEHN